MLHGISRAVPSEPLAHAYEEGSAVFYREIDHYSEHRDSWTVGDTPRKHDRAFIVLVCLRWPAGRNDCWGTDSHDCPEASREVWCSDLERAMRWCGQTSCRMGHGTDEDSRHQALPVAAPDGAAAPSKIVVNM